MKWASSDRGVFFSLAFKIWQAVAGVLGLVLIARFLDPVAQGYFYTFASVIALQSFFELGLYLVISVCASHEWAHLRLSDKGRIEGDRDAHSRLVSLGRFVFRWYGIAALLFWLLASGFGYHFFSTQSGVQPDWCSPWLLHALFSALAMWLMPFLSLLEGCNQVASTASFRLVQSIVSSIALWAALVGGLALWAAPILSGVSLTLVLVYLVFAKRHFFASFLKPPQFATLSWRHELLPMQWRLAIQGVFSYFSFPLYTALIFSTVGAAEAGRMGMTLQIVTAMQSIALVLVTARVPMFAILAARQDRKVLVQLWQKASAHALLLMIAFTLLFLAALSGALMLEWPAAQRVLPTGAAAFLCAGATLALMVQCVAFYLRAHREERLTVAGVASGLLYGCSAWLAAPQWGAWGVAASYVLVTACVTLPITLLVFYRWRRAHSHF